MVSRKFETKRPVGVDPDATHTGKLDRLLEMVPTILTTVSEVHHLLVTRQKSHYTVEEVAELTGRAPYTVRTWVKEGLVAATRVDGTGPRGRLLIPREELRKLVEHGRGNQTADAVVG